jgi:Helicase HerA, central domain
LVIRVHPARELVSQAAWRLHPQTEIGLDGIRIADGKYVASSDGSKVRSMALFRVGIPDLAEDPRVDYSAALKTTLQQQRVKGLFEGLRRARVPFVYLMLMNHSGERGDEEPVLEFDLVVGTWVDGKKKEDSAAALEQRASILSATLSVALPTARVDRLLRRELSEFVRSALLPGGKPLPQAGSASVAGALCTFDELSPAAAGIERAPDFYVPNAAESGPEGFTLGALRSGGREFHDFRLRLEDLKRHVSVLGATGSGKSTTSAVIVRQAAEAGLPIMVLDWHI